MTKPRTAPRGGKPDTAPEHNHAILSQAEQARHLGVRDEVMRNLGHEMQQDDLTRHPLAKVQDYTGDRAGERVERGPPRSQGVYRSFKNPESGISSEENLARWSGYSRANTQSLNGRGRDSKPPSMPDPRLSGRHLIGPGAKGDSDGYLASTKEWASFEYGGDSGLGRLEKSQKY
jgi:hypothetical protein